MYDVIVLIRQDIKDSKLASRIFWEDHVIGAATSYRMAGYKATPACAIEARLHAMH